MTDAMKAEAVNNAAQQQYELRVGGRVVSHLTYSTAGPVVQLTHTVTAPEEAGHGYASQIVEFALNDLRAQGKRVDPQCSFVANFVQEHAEYADLVNH